MHGMHAVTEQTAPMGILKLVGNAILSQVLRLVISAAILVALVSFVRVAFASKFQAFKDKKAKAAVDKSDGKAAKDGAKSQKSSGKATKTTAKGQKQGAKTSKTSGKATKTNYKTSGGKNTSKSQKNAHKASK